MNNCKNCGNKIFEEKMGNFKCYLKERACVRSEIDFGCPDWSEKRAIKIEEKPIRVDGATFIPHISEDGIISWTNDQGLPNPKPVQLKAGLDGTDGVGIESIEKTSTNGLVDIYTITYTNGDTSTFTVTNGRNGVDGSGSGGGVVTGITITDITESEDDGGENIITFSDGSTVTVKNGSKGSQGEQGPKGDKGDTGEQGIQGPKGDKGDTGEQGIQGPKGDKGDQGEPGTDGKNGTDGADGHTPVKGEDYFTEADISEMVSAVIASLPKYNGEVVTE